MALLGIVGIGLHDLVLRAELPDEKTEVIQVLWGWLKKNVSKVGLNHALNRGRRRNVAVEM